MKDEDMNNKHLNDESDPISRFMFGSGDRNENSRKTQEEMETRRYLADDWLFGNRNRASEESNKTADSHDNKVDQILNNIDFQELLNNIDTLVSSTGQLKPLLKKAGPILQQFMKK